MIQTEIDRASVFVVHCVPFKPLSLLIAPYRFGVKRNVFIVMITIRFEGEGESAASGFYRTYATYRAYSMFHQYNDGRDEPPSSEVFMLAIVCVPSPLPQAYIKYTIGNPPARRVRPAA